MPGRFTVASNTPNPKRVEAPAPDFSDKQPGELHGNQGAQPQEEDQDPEDGVIGSGAVLYVRDVY